MPDNASIPASGIKVTALSLADLTMILSKSAGKPVDVESLRRDIESGAPVNPDGTVNLVHYAAWLAREYATHGD